MKCGDISNSGEDDCGYNGDDGGGDELFRVDYTGCD